MNTLPKQSHDPQANSVAAGLWREALVGIPKVDQQTWQQLPWLLRWLIATRASVLPLTVFSVLFAAPLIAPGNSTQWLVLVLVLLGLTFAHATNNLINDYVDFRTGLDTDNYFRTRYGTAILASGIITPAQFMRLIIVTGVFAAGLGIAACLYQGQNVYLYAAAGAFFVLFYTYPLKRMALGELAVFLAWGPLMVGGAYAAVHGHVPPEVLAAGMVYGLGPTVVIFAKHTDKIQDDRSRGVKTLPVLCGAERSRYIIGMLAMMQFTAAGIVAFVYQFYGLLAIALAFFSLKQLIQNVAAAKPSSPDSAYSAEQWVLWHTSAAFIYARNAGFFLTLGVLAQETIKYVMR